MIDIPASVRTEVDAHPYPLVFATISGAHLYGFASPDSDWDIRGVHVLPLVAVAGLEQGDETIERMLDGPPELDIVTHDAAKFMRLLLKPNGYVLEQLLSPLLVTTNPAHDELRHLARGCVTKYHVRYYKGFAMSQWDLFRKESPPRARSRLACGRRGLHPGEAELFVQDSEVCFDFADEDISVEGLIAGKPSGERGESLERGLAGRAG